MISESLKFKIGIEYDGEFLHEKKKQDQAKNNALKDEKSFNKGKRKRIAILSESNIQVKKIELMIAT